ncbi:MAG: YiiX family permuted papain-like enzyme [Leptospiraceae bacterium]|nr:YiiX family permuted papain-like enzyme [Leptospiraceae bacterium]
MSLTAGLAAQDLQSVLKEGDLLFQETRSRQALALQLATKSRYTHVGMAIWHANQWQVIEAVQPVRITPLGQFLDRGVNRHVVVKRLLNREKHLKAAKIRELKKYASQFLGRNYDLYFSWDDERIYCTELVWKTWKHVLHIEPGKLQRLQDFDLSHPLVQQLMRERYGNQVPLEEPVIAVSTMFEAPQLKLVFQQGR